MMRVACFLWWWNDESIKGTRHDDEVEGSGVV